MRVRAVYVPALLVAGALLLGCRREELPAAADVAREGARQAVPTTGPLIAPVVAAHYFGRDWPKNFMNAFRREYVAEDFRRLRDDGFNAVIFVVSWGDFQPTIDPCCGYDERSFERLDFLMEQAEAAGLDVILRVGYEWSLNPRAGTSWVRVEKLMNQPRVRGAYLDFIAHLGRRVARNPRVIMSFMTWEDQRLMVIEPEARPQFEAFAASLPPDARPGGDAPLPTTSDGSAKLLHAYWDWLVMKELFEPARQHLPRLSYEVRVDKEPLFAFGGPGAPKIKEWLAHSGMYRQLGDAPITIYWAPFWGARNEGETLSAEASLGLLRHLLTETQQLAGPRQVFIDQFNFVDNTIGMGRNAVIDPAQIDTFLSQAVCVLKEHGVGGYGLWTTRDYAESPLYNPSFAYGLDGWELELATGAEPLGSVVALAGGDNVLRLAAGDRLSQTITASVGRLPHEDELPDRVCVDAVAVRDGDISVTAGVVGAPGELSFRAGERARRCIELRSRPSGKQLPLILTAGPGSEFRVFGVWFYDHVQFGGLYDNTGAPGLYLDAVRRMNRSFALQKPSHCDTKGAH